MFPIRCHLPSHEDKQLSVGVLLQPTRNRSQCLFIMVGLRRWVDTSLKVTTMICLCTGVDSIFGGKVTQGSTDPAQFCACLFSFGLEASSFSSTDISVVLTCSPDHDPVSVGSGFGSPPTSFMPQKIGYRANARFPYLVDTPTAPNPF